MVWAIWVRTDFRSYVKIDGGVWIIVVLKSPWLDGYKIIMKIPEGELK
jgi:hypothetical protein